MKKHYHTFAGYNAWANRRLYEAAGTLSDAEYRADRGAFFKSMHGTLNHLLATDRIWMKRFTEKFKKIIWINPYPKDTWNYTASTNLVRELIEDRMYPLTLAGLDEAMRELTRKR